MPCYSKTMQLLFNTVNFWRTIDIYEKCHKLWPWPMEKVMRLSQHQIYVRSNRQQSWQYGHTAGPMSVGCDNLDTCRESVLSSPTASQPTAVAADPENPVDWNWVRIDVRAVQGRTSTWHRKICHVWMGFVLLTVYVTEHVTVLSRSPDSLPEVSWRHILWLSTPQHWQDGHPEILKITDYASIFRSIFSKESNKTIIKVPEICCKRSKYSSQK